MRGICSTCRDVKISQLRLNSRDFIDIDAQRQYRASIVRV